MVLFFCVIGKFLFGITYYTKKRPSGQDSFKCFAKSEKSLGLQMISKYVFPMAVTEKSEDADYDGQKKAASRVSAGKRKISRALIAAWQYTFSMVKIKKNSRGQVSKNETWPLYFFQE